MIQDYIFLHTGKREGFAGVVQGDLGMGETMSTLLQGGGVPIVEKQIVQQTTASNRAGNSEV